MTINVTASSSTPQQNSAFVLTCLATKSSHLQQIPTIDWYNAEGNRIVTDLSGGLRVGQLVVTSDGTVIRSLTFLSLDVSHSMEYRCNASIRFIPPPYIVSKEAAWNLVVYAGPSKCTHTIATHSTIIYKEYSVCSSLGTQVIVKRRSKITI